MRKQQKLMCTYDWYMEITYVIQLCILGEFVWSKCWKPNSLGEYEMLSRVQENISNMKSILLYLCVYYLNDFFYFFI